MLLLLVLIVLLTAWYYMTEYMDNVDNRPVISEGQLDDAFQYTMDKFCEDAGHAPVTLAVGTLYPTLDEDGRLSLQPLEEELRTCRYMTCPKDSRMTDIGCRLVNTAYREFCAEKRLVWDESAESCKVDRDYCRRKGVTWSNNDCQVSGASQVGEWIVGTTVTREATKLIGTLVGRCASPPCKLNEGCVSGQGDCGSGLFCDALTSKCKNKRPIDGLCSSDSACASGNCVNSLCRPAGETANVGTAIVNNARAAGQVAENVGGAIASGATSAVDWVGSWF